MSRFYFHVFNGDVTHDDEGLELLDLAEARAVAVREARVLAAASLQEGHLNLAHRIEVSDEAGDTVLTMAYGDAFTLER